MHPILFEWLGIAMPTQPVITLAGLAIALYLLLKVARRLDLHWQIVLSGFTGALLCGLIGARLFTVLFDLPWFLEHPQQILIPQSGGLDLYGGILGALAAVAWVAHWYNVTIWRLADLFASVGLLFGAIAMCGAFLAEGAAGRIVESASAATGDYPRHPIPLYFAFGLSLAYLGSHLLRPYRLFHGFELAIFLLVVPLIRAMVSCFAEPPVIATLWRLPLINIDWTIVHAIEFCLVGLAVALMWWGKTHRFSDVV